MENKKDKKHIWWAVLEALGELMLTLLCFGAGVFILGLFGVDFKSENIDYDLIILLGLVVFFLIFGAICAFVQWVKKKLKNRKNKS